MSERIKELQASEKKWRERAQSGHLENGQLKARFAQQEQLADDFRLKWLGTLERIDELDKVQHTQSNSLKRAIGKELELQYRIAELEQENERLQDALDRVAMVADSAFHFHPDSERERFMLEKIGIIAQESGAKQP